MGFEEKVEEKMAQFAESLSQLDGARLALVEDCLRDYCRVAVQLDEVNEQVRETGTTIVNNKGNVVRNPDIMTQHQLINEKNALLPKLLKALPESARGGGIMDFVR